MMKEVVQALETGILGQIGLVAFVVAFVLVLINVFLTPKRQHDEAGAIPLDDEKDLITLE